MAAADQVRGATVILEGDIPVGNPRGLPDEDFAVLQLSAPMAFDTSIDEFFMDIDTRTSMPTGTESFCAGYGLGNWASAGTGGSWTRAAGNGTLRSATLTTIARPGSVPASAFVLGVNVSGQTMLDGDSGSTCFINNRIQGVASTAYLRTQIDFDGDGTLEDDETTGTSGTVYSAPWDFRPRVRAAITANVTLQYRMVPATTPGGAVDYFTTANGSTHTLPATGQDRTVGLGLTAIRAGRVEVAVVEPPNTMCEQIIRTAPLAGDMSLRGVCMSDALVSLL